MQRKYDEKLLENFLRDFPAEFLREKLTLHQQQPYIGGFRPDLIFKDEHNRLVIVEVQLNALDRNHLYRALEYKDLLIEQQDCSEPRLVLFCNEIPSRYERLLETHRISCIALSKNQFLEKAQQLCPELEIIENLEPPEEDSPLTVRAILKELAKAPQEIREDVDAMVFWLPGWFPFRWERAEQQSYDWLSLPTLPESTELYFDDFSSRPELEERGQPGRLAVSELPKEILVDRAALGAVSIEQVRAMEDWTDLLTHYALIGHETIEVVLGYRSGDDIYGYENYIRNRIRKFEGLWHRYGRENGYDLDKMKSDLSTLERIKFYTGKYPDLHSTAVCAKIEIVEGPGSLQHNLDRYRRIIEDRIARAPQSHADQSLEEFESFVQQDRQEWVTVRFCDIVPGGLYAVRELSRMLKNAAFDAKTDKLEKLVPKLGLMPPKNLKDIPLLGLKLTRQHFFHLKGSREEAIPSTLGTVST
jgi:hypothetical protein